MLLVMTVRPGFGGQSFMSEVVPKMTRAREVIDQAGLDVELEVDGGIDTRTAPVVALAGARLLVAGSAIFGREDALAAAGAVREAATAAGFRGARGRRATRGRRAGRDADEPASQGADRLGLGDEGGAGGRRRPGCGRGRWRTPASRSSSSRRSLTAPPPWPVTWPGWRRRSQASSSPPGVRGSAPGHLTPEGTVEVIDRHAPGLGEVMRRSSAEAAPRGIAGTRGPTVPGPRPPRFAYRGRRVPGGRARPVAARPGHPGRRSHRRPAGRGGRRAHDARSRTACKVERCSAWYCPKVRWNAPPWTCSRRPTLPCRDLRRSTIGPRSTTSDFRSAHPAAPGDPPLRGRRVVRHRHHGPRLGGRKGAEVVSLGELRYSRRRHSP